VRKTIKFRKVAYYSARRINAVDVEVSFDGVRLSICGRIWNGSHTDIVAGGQCLDTIAKYVHTPLFKKIYRLWNLYHLNDTHTGTPEQEAAVNAARDEMPGEMDWYKAACAVLERKGLLTVPAEKADPYRSPTSKHLGQPHTYECERLIHPIPPEDVALIESLFTENPS